MVDACVTGQLRRCGSCLDGQSSSVSWTCDTALGYVSVPVRKAKRRRERLKEREGGREKEREGERERAREKE